MLKQLLIVSLMVSAVLCDQNKQEVDGANEESGYKQGSLDGDVLPTKKQAFANLRNHLSELAAHAGKSALRAYSEAKPTLGQIRQDLGDGYEQITTHPKVVNSREWLKPRYEGAKVVVGEQYKRGKEFVLPRIESLKVRAKPMVEEGTKRISEAVTRIGSRVQERRNSFVAARKQSQQQPTAAADSNGEDDAEH